MTTHRSEEPPLRRHPGQNRAATRRPLAPAWPWIPRDRAEVILELLTLAISVPAAPTIMAAVTVHHLPTWWLIVAGMAVGWASDAVGILFGHCMGLYRAHRATSLPPPELSARSDIDPPHGHEASPNLGRPQ